jgi:hypothetical protein
MIYLAFFLQGRRSMLTACWQQVASITGQHLNGEDFIHDHHLRPRSLGRDVAAADTTVAAGGH